MKKGTGSKKRMSVKVLALILAVVLVVGTLPLTAMAQTAQEGAAADSVVSADAAKTGGEEQHAPEMTGQAQPSASAQPSETAGVQPETSGETVENNTQPTAAPDSTDGENGEAPAAGVRAAENTLALMTADQTETVPFTLNYTVDGVAQEGTFSEIGTVSSSSGSGKAYLASLPYGADVTSVTSTAMRTMFGGAQASVGSLEGAKSNYVENEAMASPTTASGYKTFREYFTLNEGASIPVEDVKGFAVAAQSFSPQGMDVLIVQISTKAAEEPAPFTLRYTIGSDATELTAEPKLIGTSTNGAGAIYSGGAYLVSLPEDANVTSVTYNVDGRKAITYGGKQEALVSSLHDIMQGNYVSGAEMAAPPEGSSYKTVLDNVTLNSGASIPAENVVGFACQMIRSGADKICCVAIVQISTKAAEDFYTVDIGKTGEHVGTTAGSDAYLVTVPSGTKGVKFTSTSGNTVTDVYLWDFDTPIIPSDADGKEIPFAGEHAIDRSQLVDLSSLNAEDLLAIYDALPAGDYYGYSVGDDAGTYPTYLIQVEGGAAVNYAPGRKDGVPATATVQMDAAGEWTIDLSTIFEDRNGDTLTYKVREGAGAEYRNLENANYGYAFDGTETVLTFTANDGKTDGVTYKVTLTPSLACAIAAADALVADPSGYYTTGDYWNGKDVIPGASYYAYARGTLEGFYQAFQGTLAEAKAASEKPGVSEAAKESRKKELQQAMANLMPVDKVNASVLYLALPEARRVSAKLDSYFPETTAGFAEAFDAANALYNGGAIAAEAYIAEKQWQIGDVGAALCAVLDGMVENTAWDSRLADYDSRLPDAQTLLGNYDPANMDKTKYAAEGWDAFIAAREKVAADVAMGRPSAYSKEAWDMLGRFPDDVAALWSAVFEGLKSTQTDITISLRFVNNFALRQPAAVGSPGTGAYYNESLRLSGGTSVQDAVNAAGIELAKSNNGYKPTAAYVYVNGKMFIPGKTGFNPQDEKIDWGKTWLFDGDDVVIVQTEQPNYSYYGWDSGATTLDTYKDSAALLKLTPEKETVKIGETLNFTAAMTEGYFSAAGNTSPAGGMTLFVSGPNETQAYALPTEKTLSTTDADGKTGYTFIEPGWYTVGIFDLRADQKAGMNVDGNMSKGDYYSQRVGDVISIYVEDLSGGELAESMRAFRENAQQEATALFGQYHDYDFAAGYYDETFKPSYDLCMEHLNSAQTLADLINHYNTDFLALQENAKQAMDHTALIASLRTNLGLVPDELSALDSDYNSLLSRIVSAYDRLNDYQKDLLSPKEQAAIEKLRTLREEGLPDKAAVAVTLDENAGSYSANTSYTMTPAFNYSYVDISTGRVYHCQNGNPAASRYGETFAARVNDTVEIARSVDYPSGSDGAYWLAYSADGGTNWGLFTQDLANESHKVRRLSMTYQIPADYAEDTLTIQIKTLTQAEYDAMSAGGEGEDAVKAAREQAAAVIGQMFESYDAENYTAQEFENLKTEKENALAAIAAADTVAAAEKAKEEGLAAMAAIPQKAQIHVTVRNDTYREAPWTGAIIDTYINVTDDLSMMTALLKGLQQEGFIWTGTGGTTESGMDITYLSGISKGGRSLAAFDGGAGGGWMGSLNDWFVNEGFNAFTIASGKLQAGDTVSVEYTCDLGEDIGAGVEGDTDTSLKSLSFTNAGLMPEFDPEQKTYTLVLEEGKSVTEIGFRATKRSFQARAYLNDYAPGSNTWYASGDTIPVEAGDVIHVGVGNSAWPSMGSGVETRYEIVVASDVTYLNSLIEKLPTKTGATLADKPTVETCRALYNSFTREQRAQVVGYDKVTTLLARMTELEKIEAVKTLIEALPEVDRLVFGDYAQVAVAKQKYDSLGALAEEVPVYIVTKLNAALARMEELKALVDVEDIYTETGAYIHTTVKDPIVASTGGEWAVIGLARSEYGVDADYYGKYVANVLNTVQEKNGVLDKRKYTEYSRVVLGLTSVGYDVTNVAGYNLLEPLADYDKVVWQGINGPVWALIALDSHQYEIPKAPDGVKQTTRENLIETILNQEKSGGGWALSGTNADSDITGMAIQALAPYYDSNADVKAAVDRALGKLSSMQGDDGGFGSFGSAASESCAQVIVALTSLGINPDTDPRFVKNGTSVVDALLTYSVPGGGFKHVITGDRDGMASEQGYYALAAYNRFLSGKTSLYDMSDVELQAPYQTVIKLIDAIGSVNLESAAAVQAARAAYDSLPDAQKSKVNNYGKLTAAEKKLAELQKPIDEVKSMIDGIGEVTLASGPAILGARGAYEKLSEEEKQLVTNYAKLTGAEAKFAQLQKADSVKRLIDAIGEVPKDSEGAIRAARAAYDALSAEEKALVGNYSALTAAERAFEALGSGGQKEEGNGETDTAQPEGTTKSLGSGQTQVTVDGITYNVSREAAEAIKKIAAMPLDEAYDLEAVLEAYRLYDALNDKQKAEVVNFADLEAQMNRVGVDNHKDDAAGLRAEGLEWYIKLEATPVEAAHADFEKLAGSIGSNTLVKMYDIKLTNLLTGEEHQPAAEINLRMVSPDLSEYDNVVIVHYTDDGKVEYIGCTLENGELVWKAKSFSYYGIIGGAAESKLLLEDGSEETEVKAAPVAAPVSQPSMMWLWIVIVCVGAAAVILAVLAKTGKLRAGRKE